MTHFSMKTLILSLSLLHIVTCTVYNVIPDDHNTICNHCHTLQYYQLNISKYFTSNTQLLFLPGLHHLHTDLIIQNVHNISLIGSTANDTTLDTVIQCDELISIVMTNITNLTIKNLMIQNGKLVLNNSLDVLFSLITIRDCKNVIVDHLQIYKLYDDTLYSIVVINVLGKSQLSHLLCYNIKLCYNDTEMDTEDNTLLVDHYQTQKLRFNNYYQEDYSIELSMNQFSYRVTVQLHSITVEHKRNAFILIKHMTVSTILIITNSLFRFNYIELFTTNAYYIHNEWNAGFIYFSNCQFLQNTSPCLIRLESITININHCIFYNNTQILSIDTDSMIIISNTSFANTYFDCTFYKHTDFIMISDAVLTFAGMVTFADIYCGDSIISLKGLSKITCKGSLKFTNNNVHNIINFEDNVNYEFMMVEQSAVIEISQNQVCTIFKTETSIRIPFPLCFFQYIRNERINESTGHIIFHYNKYHGAKTNCVFNIPLTNCLWLPQSPFMGMFPLDVNKQYIQYYDNNNYSIETLSINQNTLCICSDDINYDCHISDLGYLYPGQTLIIFLHSISNFDTDVVVVNIDIDLPYIKPCIVLNIIEYRQFIDKSCTKLNFTISFSSYEWCEIYLKLLSDKYSEVNIFTIRKLKCPPGFAEINKICQCDSEITSFVTSCNVNDQTISRPANSWISATTTHNNSYTYQISLHCPFHYCLPHSSHLNFSTPNSQCQFNRSGLLCGQCQQGLSSVFGSVYCQKCSNIYILLIIPIAIAGLVLVFFIFHLNLTVTDGNINAFILYTNIISINIPVFFPSTNEIMPAHTFISLANLDLGIQTCFYNGMDDYAKMWLRLSCPFYLIFIATLLIISSRHYTTIQRFTARRALPVLATLFVLSYTKILQAVSSVIFFYSSITHLPSKHTRLVWSVDANVTLFGFQFTILFIVCLILLLILLTFNIILLFTRTLSRFRFINKFKPLLDAYQGPYKDKFYYWTGLQLLLRAVFFGLSSLDRNINLVVGIILLGIFGGVTGVVRPFKDNVKNYQELLLIFNLHGLYTISQYVQDGANQTVVNVMITISAVQFMFILSYHTITYGCGGVFRNKIHFCVNSLVRCISRLQKRSQHQHFQLQDITRDNIPEVTFNYREFREPIVGYN